MASSSSSPTSTSPSLLPKEPLPWRPNTRPRLPPGALLDIDQGPLYDIFTEWLKIEDICHLDSALCQKWRRAEFLALVSTKVLLFERVGIDVLEPFFAISSITPLGAAALRWVLKRGIHLASLHLRKDNNNNDSDNSMSRTEQESISESIASLALDGRLDKLETISLGECTYIKDADISGILSKCLRSAKSIDIRGCGLTESSAPSLIKLCTKLEAFAASGNESSADLVAIFQSCRKLRKVDLYALDDRLTDDVVQSVAENCAFLEYLDISCCDEVSDEAVRTVAESCPLLQYVDFWGIRNISDATVVTLCNRCSLLKQINIGYCNNLTDAAVLAVAERLPGLTHINLRDIAAITSSAVETLASKCRELENIYLGGCPNVSNITLEKIAEYCSKLVVLYVRRCPKVTCAGLTAIATKCSKLETVYADDRPEILAESLGAGSLKELFPGVSWKLS